MNPIGDAMHTLCDHIAATRQARRHEAAMRAKVANDLIERSASSSSKDKLEPKSPPTPPKRPASADLERLKWMMVGKAINDQEQQDAANLAAAKRPCGPGDAGEGTSGG